VKPNRLWIVAPLGTLALVCVSTVARAQIPLFDHLQCFPVTGGNASPVPKTITADLVPEQSPPFAAAPGCRVRPKPRLLCIDVAKENVQPPGATLPLNGEPTRDYLCYDVKCPKTTAGLVNDIVTDQFGEHRITTRASKYLCVPAIHGPSPRPTAAPCSQNGAGQCGAGCGAGDRCLFVPSGVSIVNFYPIDVVGHDDCRCVPSELACGNASPSICAVVGPSLLCPASSEECDPQTCACQAAGGVPCGTTVCPVGKVCCNPLLDICTDPGGICVQ
jgi:hypothetical protein